MSGDSSRDGGGAPADQGASRIDWSGVMRAHDIDPDADDRSPVVTPAADGAPEDAAVEAEPGPESGSPTDPATGAPAAAPRGGRWIQLLVALAALFSVAASAAVLLALWRERGGDEPALAAPREHLPAYSPAPVFDEPPPAPPPLPLRAPEPDETAAAAPVVDETGDVPPEAATAAAGGPTANRTPPAAASAPAAGANRPAPATRPPAPRTAAARPAPVSSPAPAPAAGERPSGKRPADDGAPDLETRPPPPVDLPEVPSSADVAAGVKPLEPAIARCGAEHGASGAVDIKMHVTPDGKVSWASAKLSNSPFQKCLDRVFKKASMAPSVKGATVRHTVTLP